MHGAIHLEPDSLQDMRPTDELQLDCQEVVISAAAQVIMPHVDHDSTSQSILITTQNDERLWSIQLFDRGDLEV